MTGKGSKAPAKVEILAPSGDPAFVGFFGGEFQTLLETVEIPGFTGPVSWDRRAAYLLWLLGAEYDQTSMATGDWLDALRSACRDRARSGEAAPHAVSPAPALLAPASGALLWAAWGPVMLNFDSAQFTGPWET